MLFSSLTYVFFLLLVVLLYWRLPRQFRILLLLVSSLIFYMAWSPPFGLIYAPVIIVDALYFYGLSHAMIRFPQSKKRWLVLGIISELCLLSVFKYANFLTGSAEGVLHLLHLPAFHVEFHIFLPLAISFTNFILMSYLVDVYRGDEVPQATFVEFATYVMFFPHLIAGPIVRAKELLQQLEHVPPFSKAMFAQGLDWFLVGLVMKLLVADQLASYVDLIFRQPHLQAFDSSWLGIYAFAVQIFCDFAGYTLMAKGSAAMLGLSLPDNFNAPYFAINIQDFWRRWHMSLSRWLRDYLYIPLGGSRHGRVKTMRNLFITMGLGGLWHGANWTFVIWGLYQGLLLSLHKLAVYWKLNRWIPKIVAWALTFHLVCLGWVFFRASSLWEAVHYLSTMMNPRHQLGLLHNMALVGSKTTIATILLFFLIHGVIRLGRRWALSPNLLLWVRTGVYFLILYSLLTQAAPSQTFIYFQF